MYQLRELGGLCCPLLSGATKETKTTTRMNKKLVTFEHPFLLDEVEKELPAGDYTVETEEESIDGLTFLAFRRVETTLIVRPAIGKRGQTHFFTIDPQGLDLALERDAARTLELDSAHDNSPSTIRLKSESPRG